MKLQNVLGGLLTNLEFDKQTSGELLNGKGGLSWVRLLQSKRGVCQRMDTFLRFTTKINKTKLLTENRAMHLV